MRSVGAVELMVGVVDVRWWKVVGLAGLAGVAATGVVIARRERQRRAFTPEQVRDRLQARYAEIASR
jgi:hypothetical protein